MATKTIFETSSDAEKIFFKCSYEMTVMSSRTGGFKLCCSASFPLPSTHRVFIIHAVTIREINLILEAGFYHWHFHG